MSFLGSDWCYTSHTCMNKIMKLTFKILLSLFAGLLLITLVIVGSLAWRLSKGPIDLQSFLPTIQKQINQQLGDDTIEIGELRLQWQRKDHILGLEARAVQVRNARGPFLFAPAVDITLSFMPLLWGQLELESIWIRDVMLSITQQADGTIQITGETDMDSDTRETYVRTQTVPATITLNDVIKDLPQFETLWIDDAKIIYSDTKIDRTQVFDPVTVLVERNRENLAGFVTFPFAKTTADNVVKVNFYTDSDPLAIMLSGTIKNTAVDDLIEFLPPLPEGVDIDAVIDASIKMRMDANWGIEQFDISAVAQQGRITVTLNENDDDYFDFKDLSLKLSQDIETHIVTIEQASFTLNDTAQIEMTGQIKNPQQKETMGGDISVTIGTLPTEWFPRYWPDDARDNGAYEWLTQKVTGGQFNDLSAKVVFDRTVTQRADDKPLPAWLTSVVATFGYEGVKVDYKSPLIPATAVSGTGKYEDISLTLDIAKANLGDEVVTEGANLFFDDLITSGAGHATMSFPLKGSVKGVFDYIAKEPINAMDKMTFDPSTAKGNADLQVDVSFPTLAELPIEDVKVDVKGTLSNVELGNVVKNLTLSGGPYDIEASSEFVHLKGSGQLQGKPITLDWHEYFSAKESAEYLSKITAQLTANDAIRRAFMKENADYFIGDTEVELTYIAAKNGQDSSLDLSLGLIDTTIKIDEIGLNKEFSKKVDATLDIELVNGNPKSVKNLVIKGSPLSLSKGSIDFEMRGKEAVMTKASLQNVAFGENKFSAEYARANGHAKANITGAFLDARSFLEKEKGDETGVSVEVGIDVAELRMADKTTLGNPKIFVLSNEHGRLDRFEMDAKAGEGNLQIRYDPAREDGLTLQVQSDNAGDTLRAFDLYPYIQGGTLQIAGQPNPAGRYGDVKGVARINDFKVSNAPVLLRLINALSFENFLNAGALGFSRLETEFEWTQSKAGDVYKISNGRTAGASIGLTFDGFVDMVKKEINITGTAAPMSGLNNMIGNIPIIGDILTGGGALVAATYSITGSSDDPQVGVNPLSVLTPGIIRKILFENTPQTGSGNEETKSEAEKAKRFN